ncbi:hypothetical protein [Janthinobacterium sp. DSP2-3-3]|uniref:hypothetical protein n=1 Tax=Janthinobacterium sp. DSP2-3-3 TaxID=2804596 RepID=UPI003CF1B7CF
MTVFYSNNARGFFPAAMRAAYESAGTWPDDGIEVSTEDEALLRDALSSGAIIQEKFEGEWKITSRPAAPFGELAAPYLTKLRQVRDDILNRLAGIGFAAMAANDAATVQHVLEVRQALLDITVAPAILAATDLDGLTAAMKAAYASIIATAAPIIREAFDPAAI